jgi:Highly conserved protein containing a thioredoxin domain
MKKHLLIIPALLVSMLGFGQGIEFEHGTWKEVLDKAQKTNKPIFVDVYTSWCGPCKMMSKDIFPLEEVGKVFNANYVCYKIDAEKGEGVDIAKQYEVKAYPTYLFIKPDGTLFFRSLGSMDAKRFITESEKAMVEWKDPKPLNVWDKEYASKKNDPAFLFAYMEKRSKLGMPNTIQFDEYLKLLPEAERISPAVVELYKKEGRDIKINTFAYTYLQKNIKTFENILGIDKAHVNSILFMGIVNSLPEAAKAKNEKLLAEIGAAYDLLPSKKDVYMQKDEIYMQYYQRTEETDKYLKYATSFANNYLLKITDETIAEKVNYNIRQSEDYNKAKHPDTYKIDTAQLTKRRLFQISMEKSMVSENLNNIAWKVFEEMSDKAILQNALVWSKRSLELTPKNAGWMDTYANILYRLGQKEEAIAKEEEALSIIDKKDASGYEETIRKMKAGEKTWKN